MGLEINPQTLSLIIAGFVFLSFVVLCILLIKVSAAQKYVEQSKNIQDSLEGLNGTLEVKLKALDERLSRDQQQLFSNIMQDRERQLNSIGELRVELEKRFSETSLSLTNNVQAFKADMVEKFEKLQRGSSVSLAEGQQQISSTVNQFGEKLNRSLEQHQTQTREAITDNIRKGIKDLRTDLDRSIQQQNDAIGKSISGLTESTDNRLKEISSQVEKRLSEGFDKTTKTFNDVLKRLALIDDAQKKITELSSNVVSLQEILNDKRSRGAFGEVQLQSLVSNIMPESHYSMQYKFSNEKIADCVLELPEPTGKIAIDAKFPLESFKKMTDITRAESDRKDASRQFAKDIKKHINDISEKYVLPPETSDGAVMFIPAESVFAEIHGHYPGLVEHAYHKKVWMVSPTTLMAILTTASAVIKDEQTRKQVHIIKDHLSALGKDFVRFQSRMDSLSRHIGQVSKDVEQVHTSARKITSRFDKIERVDVSLEHADDASVALTPPDELVNE
ncbi:MAG: DNA recombination protein RmuC [Kangiellaceae bacterium]|nr:DNA recombination protein RmuC [Kangiellaceae bacterium]MCW8998635.1 DNA recombination protein RmuC [Kangiellaceae bacterium]